MSKGPDEVKRSVRVAERLRMELSEIIMRGRFRDPRAEGMIISAVRVSGDLSVATIYVRKLGEASEKQRESMVEALEKGAGFLRRELGPKLRLRRTPELRFMWDDLVDSATRIEEILHNISSEGDNGDSSSDVPDGDHS